MATEFPIEQDFGREIPGQTADDIQENADGSAEMELDLDDSQIEELPDGSVVMNLEDFKGPDEDEDFYSNLAEDVISPFDMGGLAIEYIDLIEKDKQARELRDKQYEEGIRRTGMGNDAPGGATFAGASKVVHPVMAEACVDFASRAIKELFPPDGPTKTKILGDVDKDKAEVAERKRDYMNWQLTEQIEEFRDEQEQLLTQLPLGGSQYLKLWYDEQKRRPCAEFVPIDNVYLPFSAANFYTAQRVTEVHYITEQEFKRRMDIGLYRDVDFVRATMDPDESKAEKANNKIEGKKWDENVDGTRTVYHVYTWMELEDDTRSGGKLAPYILMIDDLNHEILGVYRNWEEGDDTMTKLDWLIEFKFIPWRGAYAVGLPHLIGGLSAALTGSLRALLDSAHINNAATMLKLKGAKMSGQSQQVDVTQIVEVEGAPGVDDIRKIAMPMPFNPPSDVLFKLMGFLEQGAKGVVTTAEEKIADINSNMPVGTTQALIEQGAAVFSAIHARLHDAQGRVLKVLGRLNRWYLDEQKKGDVVADLEIRKEDFKRNTDVVPVSDPHIFSETQRMAQIQAVVARSDQHPELYNAKAVEERLLKQLKIPAVNELLRNTPDPEKRDPANENVAMATGQPAFAYQDQDHLAHIQSHLDFAKDPIMGSNPLIAPSFVPNVIEHLKQHLTLWYLNRMNGYVTKAVGHPITDYELPENTEKVDKLFGVASQHVSLDTQTVFQGILPIIQGLMQQAQQMRQQAQQLPMTPDAKVLLDTSMAETQRRAKRDEAEMQLKAKQIQDDVALEKEKNEKDLMVAQMDNQTKEQIEAAKQTSQAVKLQNDQAKTALDMLTKGV